MKWIKLLLALISCLAIGVAVYIAAPADAATSPLVVEAESMTLAGSTINLTDSSASGGHSILFNSGAGVATRTTGAVENVTVRARGAECFGQADLRTWLDGVQVGYSTMTGSWADYTYAINKPAGSHTLKVEFVNPGSFFCTRQLMVDKSTLAITVPPTTTTPPTTTPTTTTTTPTTTTTTPSTTTTTTTTPTTTTTTTPTTTTTTPPPGSNCPTTAAAAHNWGTASTVEDFNFKPNSNTGWDVYNGPGHNGNGLRTPNAVSAANGIMTITGSPNGESGGMAWQTTRSLRGRWEVCMKTAAGSVNYHPVMLLWASSGGGVQATNGEVDFTEIVGSADRQRVSFFLHWNHPPLGTGRSNGAVNIDATAWHAWAVEWTGTAIVGYVDGVEWFRDSNPDHFPTVTAGMTLQLDNFSNEGSIAAGGRMDFDWAKKYAVS